MPVPGRTPTPSITGKVAAAIASARERRGWSQRQLADRLGVSQACVSYWEQGIRGVSLTHLYRLAEVLETDVAALLPVAEHVHGGWEIETVPASGGLPDILRCGRCQQTWMVGDPTLEESVSDLVGVGGAS